LPFVGFPLRDPTTATTRTTRTRTRTRTTTTTTRRRRRTTRRRTTRRRRTTTTTTRRRTTESGNSRPFKGRKSAFVQVAGRLSGTPPLPGEKENPPMSFGGGLGLRNSLSSDHCLCF